MYHPSATFQFLFRKFVVDPSTSAEGGEAKPTVARMLLLGIALNGLLATPVMMAQMAMLQLISGDIQVQKCEFLLKVGKFGQILYVVCCAVDKMS